MIQLRFKAPLQALLCVALCAGVQASASAAGVSCRETHVQESVSGASGDRVFFVPQVSIFDPSSRTTDIFDLSSISIAGLSDGLHVTEVGRSEKIFPPNSVVKPLLNVCVASPGASLFQFLEKLTPNYTIP